MNHSIKKALLVLLISAGLAGQVQGSTVLAVQVKSAGATQVWKILRSAQALREFVGASVQKHITLKNGLVAALAVGAYFVLKHWSGPTFFRKGEGNLVLSSNNVGRTQPQVTQLVAEEPVASTVEEAHAAQGGGAADRMDVIHEESKESDSDEFEAKINQGGGGGAAAQLEATVFSCVNQRGEVETRNLKTNNVSNIVQEFGLPEGTKLSFLVNGEICHSVPQGGIVQIVVGEGEVTDPRFLGSLDVNTPGVNISDVNTDPTAPLCGHSMFFTTGTGKKLDIDCSKITSLYQLTSHMAEELECFPRDVVIIFCGNRLETSDAFRNADIIREGCCHVVVRTNRKSKNFNLDTITSEVFGTATADELKDLVVVFFMSRQYCYPTQGSLDRATEKANTLYRNICQKLGKNYEDAISAAAIGQVADQPLVLDKEGNTLAGNKPRNYVAPRYFTEGAMADLKLKHQDDLVELSDDYLRERRAQDENTLNTLAYECEMKETSLCFGRDQKVSDLIESAKDFLNEVATKLIVEHGVQNVTYEMLHRVLKEKSYALEPIYVQAIEARRQAEADAAGDDDSGSGSDSDD